MTLQGQAITNPDTVLSIKSHMGEAGYKVTIDGKDYTTEISAMHNTSRSMLKITVRQLIRLLLRTCILNDAQRQA